MVKHHKNRCYIYTRVSTEVQVDGYSLEAQKDVLEKEAAHRNMTVVEIFSDEGRSGKNISGRPQFQRMMARIQAGNKDEISYVLVYKLSRFGRNTADVLNNVQLMEDYGVHLYSVEDHIDSADDAGKLMISVLASVSEMERENIRVQTMSGRIQKAKDGKWNGGQAPYGYALDNGALVVNEDEAEVIRLIFKLFTKDGYSMNRIAKYLNDAGYRKNARQTGTNEQFATSFVKGVLDNPVYAGYIAYGRRGNEKITGRRNEYHIVKKSEYGMYEGQHEPLVDRDTWDTAKMRRSETSISWDKKHSIEHAHVLSGILKCPRCGAPMYGVVCRKKKPDGTFYKDMWYYRCKHRIKVDGHNCNYKTHIPQDILNEQVKYYVRLAMRDTDFNDMIKQAVGILDDSQELFDELKRLEDARAKTESRKKKILQKIQALDPDDEAYDDLYDGLQEIIRGYSGEIADLGAQIRKAQQAIKNTGERAQIERNIRQMIQSIIDGMDTLTMEQERGLMHALVEKVEVFEQPVEEGLWVKSILFRFPMKMNGNTFREFYYEPDKEEGDSLPNESHVETVCLLTHS